MDHRESKTDARLLGRGQQSPNDINRFLQKDIEHEPKRGQDTGAATRQTNTQSVDLHGGLVCGIFQRNLSAQKER